MSEISPDMIKTRAGSGMDAGWLAGWRVATGCRRGRKKRDAQRGAGEKLRPPGKLQRVLAEWRRKGKKEKKWHKNLTGEVFNHPDCAVTLLKMRQKGRIRWIIIRGTCLTHPLYL